ncbi:signal peptidase I [Granulicella tundricola]|uniref:Signal peptidase I n=1 Tax=Granulicella tundricola (strain ATCC BAA-1859 / DSM 23138 / MP5ACTX9) TaxID=1198114 RepID=E8X1H5_GRATM|nr:signal peptidase I [Granulicella tundricola]ADW70210.1 signal peptidase I [Granulicella tundricola MP5ACTX9]
MQTVETTNDPALEPLAAQNEAEPEIRKENLAEAIASIATVLVVGLFVMTFIAQNFVIPSGSMEKTLLVGDHVLVDRVTFAPETRWAPFVHYRDIRRGDVIVFLKPNPETPDMVLVKRAIGIPGDHIHLQHGTVYLNGVAQDEPTAAKVRSDGDADDAYQPARDDFPANGAPAGSTEVWNEDLASHIQNGDLVVPPGKVFAMGDNRTHSLDGRFWGFVPRENILGRPLFNYWSFEANSDEMEQEAGMGTRIGSLGHTALHFFDKTRWKRTLHLIK